MPSSLDDFLTAATRAARPDARHPGAALEARAYLAVAVRIIRAVLAECDEGERWGRSLPPRLIYDAMTNARRNKVTPTSTEERQEALDAAIEDAATMLDDARKPGVSWQGRRALADAATTRLNEGLYP